jgi:hypothetical protein
MTKTETPRQNGGVTWGLKTPTQQAHTASDLGT